MTHTAPSSHDPSVVSLTPSQEVAVAKLAAGIAKPGTITVLCGPQGVGKTTVVAALARSERQRGRTVAIHDLNDWHSASTEALPEIVIAESAHRADDGDLRTLLAACRRRSPKASLLLVGEGRLLTILARDGAVEQAVHLRASLRPCSVEESRHILTAQPARDAMASDAVTATMHEIAAGIPAAMLRLADLAAVVAEARPGTLLTTADIEAIHARLSPLAA